MMAQLVTTKLGAFSICVWTWVKEAQNVPTLKIHGKEKIQLQQNFFHTNHQCNKENILSKKN